MSLSNQKYQSYHKLTLYQKARELVTLTYKLTSKYPKEELYVLVPQMRRASIPIMANLVEGYSKKSRKEFARFLDISIGSATELEIYFDISLELKYSGKIDLERAFSLLLEVKKLLYSFQRSLRGRVKETKED